MNALKPFFYENTIEAGCDEAGRGCLAGPVFAAAVILPHDFICPQLNDSKKISSTQRNKLRQIIEQKALSWSVSNVSAEEIDKINILNASFLAMQKAIEKLHIQPQHLLIDGNKFRPGNITIPYTCIIKGDAKIMSIAAASILAKTHRDEYMMKIHQDFPHYQWDKNKGYPTKAHKKNISAYGKTEHHRQTFKINHNQK